MSLSMGVQLDNSLVLYDVKVPPTAPPVGTLCVVRTHRGLEVGMVRTTPHERSSSSGRYVRPATPEDVARNAELKERAEELKWLLRAQVREQGLALKIVALEFTLDEARLTVTCTADDPAPLRTVAQLLRSQTRAEVDFSNIGVRDQARIFGACVAESCGFTWAQGFRKVTLRMARDQQLPLNPEKLNGPCGRLKCSLWFEHEMYREMLEGMPKKGAKACHSSGFCGRVTKLHPLKNSVTLGAADGTVQEFPADEVTQVNYRREDAARAER